LCTYSLAVTHELRRHAMKQLTISGRKSNTIRREENCWRLSTCGPQTPSQPPMITPNRLTAYTINAALRGQTEIGWPNLFRGFLNDTWGFAKFTISSTSTSMQSYSLVFFRKAIPALQKYSIALLWHTRILHKTPSKLNVLRMPASMLKFEPSTK